MDVKRAQKILEQILEKNGVDFAGIFGSCARGEAKGDSDVDVLVRFKESKSLFDIVGLEIELSEALNRKVDLVTERALCSHIEKGVLNDLRPIYGKR